MYCNCSDEADGPYGDAELLAFVSNNRLDRLEKPAACLDMQSIQRIWGDDERLPINDRENGSPNTRVVSRLAVTVSTHLLCIALGVCGAYVAMTAPHRVRPSAVEKSADDPTNDLRSEAPGQSLHRDAAPVDRLDLPLDSLRSERSGSYLSRQFNDAPSNSGMTEIRSGLYEHFLKLPVDELRQKLSEDDLNRKTHRSLELADMYLLMDCGAILDSMGKLRPEWRKRELWSALSPDEITYLEMERSKRAIARIKLYVAATVEDFKEISDCAGLHRLPTGQHGTNKKVYSDLLDNFDNLAIKRSEGTLRLEWRKRERRGELSTDEVDYLERERVKRAAERLILYSRAVLEEFTDLLFYFKRHRLPPGTL